MVMGTGATQIRHAFPADQVPAVIVAYMAGIKVTFVLVVALLGVSCVLAMFVPRKQLNAEALKAGGGGAALLLISSAGDCRGVVAGACSCGGGAAFALSLSGDGGACP